VAIADEIAQQTHDLEDGVRVGSVQLERVEQLRIAEVIRARLGAAYEPAAPARIRQSLLIRGMIGLFVTDVIETSAGRLEQIAARLGVTTRAGFLPHARDVSQTTIRFSAPTAELFGQLKRFIYRFIINHPQVNRQDWRARKVITGLFRAFWQNPLNLPSDVLRRATPELGLVYLRDLPLRSVAAEVASRYHSCPGFARLVADHIAGMSDRFALEEYGSLEQPSPGQRFLGDLR
jgi:dGTPase